ncbi:TrfB-related DNA-binding protein [Ectopseudomonas hydrolytica]|uniref:TrfB-related DNA-binding protein n=1 Tax=Ectopseudomonas hydrolytica TaxID=2493633 RepID=UPI0020B87A47|nr:TrfB-related DNA-binding protein [Pseudomonas hydrolytica]UTH34288.1 transcriptional regulator KorA [Pseudomonas hydrolytica]UZZ13609.1 transcriptional regulator KorA [Pseudomonas mendocina]
MPKKIDQGEQIQAERKQRGPDKAPRPKSRTLTAAEFEAVRPLLGISDERIEAARQAMVEGRKMAEIAEAFGWKSRQAVDRAVTNVWAEYQKYREGQEAAAQLLQQSKKKPAAKKTAGQ